MRRLLVVAAVVLCGGLAAAFVARGGESSEPAAEDAVVVQSNAGLFEVRVTPRPEESEVNRLHSWQLDVRDADGEPVSAATISVAGDMPAHGHGLPTRPRVRELGEGRYAVDGVKFQMGGEWYVAFEIAAADRSDVARVDFLLPG